MLKTLKTINIGPRDSLDIAFAPRLNLITGDNGLGKSFILDLAWFSLTRQWPQDLNPTLLSGGMARPKDPYKEASMQVEFYGTSRKASPKIIFNREDDFWQFPTGKAASPGIVFYAMADGSFATWDPMKKRRSSDQDMVIPALVLNSRQALDGLPAKNGGWFFEGLIKDWVSWQYNSIYKEYFELFEEILKTITSGETPIKPGKARQVSPSDMRLIPTIQMPYGEEIPITQASSGVKRIITLVYFLLWTWFRHINASEIRGKSPEKRIVFLLDDAESHLHPRWQRVIMPALMQVAHFMSEQMQAKLQIQFVVSTHSPLIMSSVEGVFNASKDCWFDLDLENGRVSLNKQNYSALGDADSWLTSEAFDLRTTYSINTEKVIDSAKKLLSSSKATPTQLKSMTNELQKVLPEMDPYWINWNAALLKRNVR